MERTDRDFKDGLALDILSPKNRTLVVKQNTSPLAAQFVTGTTGEPFVALSSYSYIIQMNETANDLIAEIEIPYEAGQLSKMGVQEANTYVATLAPDKMSWLVDDGTRNVHRSENNTRIIKMTSLNGEYMLVGRQIVDTSNIFVQYGQGATRTVNMTGGRGTQQSEFIDGMRFSVQTNQSMTMNVAIKEGINPGTLPANTVSLNSFMWIVNTSDPFRRLNAQMFVPCKLPFTISPTKDTDSFPVNRNMLVALRPEGSSPSTMLTVAKRPLNATSGTFLPFNLNQQTVFELPQDKIQISHVGQLDGQYIILVTQPQAVGQSKCADASQVKVLTRILALQPANIVAPRK